MNAAKSLRPPASAADAGSRGPILMAGGALALAVLAVYANVLGTPFVFDDIPGIVNNESIRRLSALGPVFSPPPGAAGAAGRPVVNLSLAVNFALGGTDPRGYHALNLLFHTFSALALFGIVRRTLLKAGAATRALPGAFFASLLWAVHPLQTESVTCVIQRSELLGGLFYLATLYFFIRATDEDAPRRWPLLCVASCLLGMASKEFVVSAPLLVALYDRTFVAGSFRAAWRRRRGLYVALACTWLVLAVLVSRSASRGGTVGFDLGMTAWNYALTQCRALVLYLRLSVWPHPLVLDYGFDVVTRPREVLAPAALLLALAAATFTGCWRRHALGFAGAWFFAILAPSSSVVPLITQTIADHRMYLPLAAVVVPAALAGPALATRGGIAVLAALSLAFGALTVQRNADYVSAETIWRDTLAKCPTNPRAHTQLGIVYAATGRPDEAIARYRAALRLRPDFIAAEVNLGDVLSETGRLDEALQHLQIALRLKPDSPDAHLNLGTTLDRLGRPADAIREYERALQFNPHLAGAHSNLGDALVRAGQTAAGIEHLVEALRLKPDHATAHYLLAGALARTGRLTEARVEFAAAQKLKPRDAVGLHSWANALVAAGQPAEALVQYAAAIALRPDSSEAHYNFANALASAGRLDEAVAHYTAAIRLKPDHAAAENNLGNTLALLDRDLAAVPHYERSLQLRPDDATTQNNLGLALARLGRIAEALPHFEAAVRLAPDSTSARENLARAQAELRGEAPRN